jgi:hypothetical protein
MKIAKNKKTAITIALILMLFMIGSLVLLPQGDAAVTATVVVHNSYMYTACSPHVVGVDQSVLIIAWTADIPPDIGETDGVVASPTGRAGWSGYQINVTKPNNETVLLDMPYTDPGGTIYTSYTPDTAGTYYIQAIFPDTWKNSTINPATGTLYPDETGYNARNPALSTPMDQHYLAAVSPVASFTVQSEPVTAWVETPLPTGYWTRPINSANRNWYVLAGDWLAGGSGGGGASFATPFLVPQGTYGGVPQQLVGCYGPTSAHILWTKPYYMGGLMEANYRDTGYQTAHYQGLGWTGVIILQGKIYYAPRTTDHSTSGYYVVDLYTGETLYEENDTKPAFGQIYNYESPNQHGGFAYLWRTSGQTVNNPGGINGTVWTAIDPMTGQTVYQIANVSTAGTQVYGLDGSICYYNLVNYGTTTNPDYHLTVWNSSAIPSELLGDLGTNAWQWRPATGGRGQQLGGIYVHDGTYGYSLNVSIPAPYGPRNPLLNETGTIRCIRESDYMIVGTSGRNDERGDVPGMLMAISLKPDDTLGKQLWKITFDEPYFPTTANVTTTISGVYPESNVFACANVGMQGGSKVLKWWGFDMTTGKQIWETGTEPQLEYYVNFPQTYNGLMMSEGYGGVLIAYNLTTGKQAWNYSAENIGFESPYGNYPIGISCMADGNGLIYTTGSEHSPSQPLWRGPNLRCINATDGTEVWSTLFWGAGMSPTDPSNVAMSDGILVGLNFFDNELYAFGKGPSGTTVSAPQSGATVGSVLTITGTVTDQTSSGRRNTNDLFDFSLKGTPAISDASMSAWMEYMFMQQAKPSNATGVPVSLDTIDPNGNFYHIGDVTSDSTGAYGCAFTPDVPGTYQIIATFAGSNAYGPSFAETYIAVGAAAPTASPPEYPQPIDYTMAIVLAVVVLLIAIAIATILILRKK